MKLRSILLLIIASLSIGCAKQKDGDPDVVPHVKVPDGPFLPSGSGPGSGPGDSWEFGGTAELDIHSVNRFSEYTQRPMYNPKDVQINVNLLKYGKGYGGTISIAYTDDGVPYSGHFTSGTSKDSNKYNIWFRKNGKDVWHGFFTDFMGGLIVVIDEVVDLGDGAGPEETVGGSVWFKNFGLTYAPHPPTYCWFVSLGPYDCRAWKSGDGVKTTKAVEPDSGYKLLGRFTDLNIKEAFNDELEW